jgi:hypothetical protein
MIAHRQYYSGRAEVVGFQDHAGGELNAPLAEVECALSPSKGASQQRFDRLSAHDSASAASARIRLSAQEA